jgi:hypothetical protein
MCFSVFIWLDFPEPEQAANGVTKSGSEQDQESGLD